MQVLRRSVLGGLLALPVAARADEGEVGTTDLALACTVGLAAVMQRAAAEFRDMFDVRVHVFPIGPRLLVAQMRREVQIDLVAAGLLELDELASQKLLVGPPYTGPWRDRLVIAARRGVRLETAVAGIIAVPDAGTAAGIDGKALLDGMALRVSRRLGVVDTAEGAALLSSDQVSAALMYRSEVRADMLLAEIAVVPDTIAPEQRVAVAAVMGARRPKPGAFLQFLSGNAGRRMLTDAGLEELS